MVTSHVEQPDIVRTADLAHEVGVSRQMIAHWSREGLEEAAKLGRGKWDRRAALSWISDRREDSPLLDGAGPSSGDLAAARIDLYRVQAEGGKIRNRLAIGELVRRKRAVTEISAVTAECVAIGDAWARDHTTPACAALAKHVTAAQVIAIKAEVWHEIRQLHADAVRRVDAYLAVGEDVGPTRIRVPGSMGG